MAKAYGLQAIIERETAFGAGAIASLISHRPMILELIGPKYSLLSVSVSSKVLAYNEMMVPDGVRSKTVFVKAAVNPDVFKPDAAARNNIRGRLGIEDSIVVGYVGTFQPWHGMEDLIQAARILHDSSPKMKFLLVGPIPGRVRRLIDSELAKTLIFTGPVPYESVPEYINAFDIAVAPYNVLRSSRRSIGIGSPLKVLEYMVCGIPTIGSALPQVAEIIDDGRTGLLFPQGDAKLLAEKIVELAGNSELRNRIGRNALEKVREQFSWLSFARRMQLLLEECLNPQAS